MPPTVSSTLHPGQRQQGRPGSRSAARAAAWAAAAGQAGAAAQRGSCGGVRQAPGTRKATPRARWKQLRCFLFARGRGIILQPIFNPRYCGEKSESQRLRRAHQIVSFFIFFIYFIHQAACAPARVRARIRIKRKAGTKGLYLWRQLAV